MNKMFTNRILGLWLVAMLHSPLHAEPAAAGAAKSDAKSDEKVFEEPPLSVTAHSMTVAGKTLTYHATAGYIVLKEEEGKPLVPGSKPSPEGKPDSKDEPGKTKDGLKPKAKVFFVAYTLDDVTDPATRPVT